MIIENANKKDATGRAKKARTNPTRGSTKATPLIRNMDAVMTSEVEVVNELPRPTDESIMHQLSGAWRPLCS